MSEDNIERNMISDLYKHHSNADNNIDKIATKNKHITGMRSKSVKEILTDKKTYSEMRSKSE